MLFASSNVLASLVPRPFERPGYEVVSEPDPRKIEKEGLDEAMSWVAGGGASLVPRPSPAPVFDRLQLVSSPDPTLSRGARGVGTRLACSMQKLSQKAGLVNLTT